jgi:hypothetical protein
MYNWYTPEVKQHMSIFDKTRNSIFRNKINKIKPYVRVTYYLNMLIYYLPFLLLFLRALEV